MLPTFDEDGEIYGYVARAVDKMTKPKTISVFAENRGAWYRLHTGASGSESDELIIVEDQLSAMRARWYLHAVALLGTHVPYPVIERIKKGNYKKVWLALDRDALPKAVKLAGTLRALGIPVRVLPLKEDLKDMTEQQIISLFFKYKVADDNI